MMDETRYAVIKFDLEDIQRQAELGLNPMVKYNPNELVMAKEAIKKMQHYFQSIYNSASFYTEGKPPEPEGKKRARPGHQHRGE